MKIEFSAREIPNKKTAIAVHNRLRAGGGTPISLGRFYTAMLERRLWPTQHALASDLDVSGSQVSRSMAIARLPDAVIEAFEDEKRITYRMAKTLETVIGSLGIEVVSRNAALVPRRRGLKAAEVLNAIVRGKDEFGIVSHLKLTVAPTNDHIRIDSPHLAKLIPLLPQLEQMLQVLTSRIASVDAVGRVDG